VTFKGFVTIDYEPLLLYRVRLRIYSRSYCCTQYDRLLAWYCRLSVRLPVYDKVYCGVQGRCGGWAVVSSCS